MKDVLTHHGILGMKWGVRRSQADLDRIAGRKAQKEAIRNTKRDRREAIKNITQLSDEELDARLKRAQKEQQLKQYSGYQVNGKGFARASLEQIGSKAITAVVAGTTVYLGKKLVGSDQTSLFDMDKIDVKDIMRDVLERFGR